MNLPFESGFASALQNAGSVQQQRLRAGSDAHAARREDARARLDVDGELLAQQEQRCSTSAASTQIFAGSVNSDLKLARIVDSGRPVARRVLWIPG